MKSVAELRKHLGLSQAQFSAVFRLPAGAVKAWEYGKRTPSGAAETYLLMIDADPGGVLKILEKLETNQYVPPKNLGETKTDGST